MRHINIRHTHSPLRVVSRQGLAVLLVASMGLVATAGAQPSGNPKGTVTPPETSAPKGRASDAGRPRGTDADQGKLVGNEAQTRARVQSSTPPPGGGTAGGLQPRGSTSGAGGSGVRSDKGSAAPAPVPPSR